jgi:hypothetical protein
MFCVDIQDRQVRHRTSGNANQFTLMPLPQIADNSGINAGIKEAVWACWRFASVAGEGREAVFCEAERAIHREHRTHRGIPNARTLGSRCQVAYLAVVSNKKRTCIVGPAQGRRLRSRRPSARGMSRGANR